MELSEKEILAAIEGYEKQGRYWVPTPGVVEQQMFIGGFLFGKEYFSHDWQDISKAPRDGTVVDLWHKDGYRALNCSIDNKDNIYELQETGVYFSVACTLEGFTHFRYITGPEDA